VSFLRHFTSRVTHGYAWGPSSDLVDFLKAFLAKEKGVVLYRCCTAVTQPPAVDALLPPPNLCGLLLMTDYDRKKNDPRCEVARKEAEPACPHCLLVAGSSLRKILEQYAAKELCNVRRPQYSFLNPPAFASVVRPGRGVLIDIPAGAGTVALVFSGVCCFIKCTKRSSESIVEMRLPKEHVEDSIACDDLAPGYLIHGLKGSKSPEVLVQLVFSDAAKVALFVPTPESSPWLDDDADTAFSTRPGYVYNMISLKNEHVFTSFAAADLWDALVKPDEDVQEHRGFKRTREETTTGGTEDDFPLPCDDGHTVPEDMDEVSAPAAHPHFTPLTLEAPPSPATTGFYHDRLGFLDADMITNGSLFAPALHHTPSRHLPTFYLHPFTQTRFHVKSEYGQHASVWIHRGLNRTPAKQPGVFVRTTGLYFCTVQRNEDQSFELVTQAEINSPLSDLDDSYWINPSDFDKSVDDFEKYSDISLHDLQTLGFQ
jgi:hypothetical protein